MTSEEEGDTGGTGAAATDMPRLPEHLPYLRRNRMQTRDGRAFRMNQPADPTCQHMALLISACNQWGFNVRCPDCPLRAHLRWQSDQEPLNTTKEEMKQIALRVMDV